MAAKVNPAVFAERQLSAANMRSGRRFIAASARSKAWRLRLVWLLSAASGRNALQLLQQRLVHVSRQEVGDIALVARHFFHQRRGDK